MNSEGVGTTTMHTEGKSRTQKTKDAFIRAMISWLDTHESPPNITEIVRTVGTSRPTFYMYFASIPALMIEAMQYRTRGILGPPVPAGLQPEPGSEWPELTSKNFMRIFTHVHDHQQFYRAVLCGPSARTCEDALTQLVALRLSTSHVFKHRINNAAHPLDPENYARLIAAGLVNLMIHALTNQVPPERTVVTALNFLAATTRGK